MQVLTAFSRTPGQVFQAWPGEWPLAAVWAGGADGGEWSRWTILARPSDDPPAGVPPDTGLEALPCLARVPDRRGADSPPGAGWIGYLGYDAGRLIEPAAQSSPGARDDRAAPLAVFRRFEDALVFDVRTGRWLGVGAWEAIARSVESLRVRGEARAPAVGPPRSATGRRAYVGQVAGVIERIRAGEIYQANIAHRLSAPFAGSTRAMFLGLVRAARPRHGVYVEHDGGGVRTAVLSASPELFLDVLPGAASARVATRPMKGTSPARAGRAGLQRSAKEAAELHMIVDVARNDLARSCRLDSVRVRTGREIERHGEGEAAVLQGVATVEGVLREGATLADLIAGAFPPASVTGAPKIRAMRVIDEVEPVRRGPYCGCAGYVGANGRAHLNVCIRTAVVTGAPGRAPGEVPDGVLDYAVGAGIVAESDPEAEWRETLVKARVLRSALRSPGLVI